MEDTQDRERCLATYPCTQRTGLSSLSMLLHQAKDMIYAMFKCGIDAIIHFGTDKYKSIFGNYEAADIKSVMLNYGGSKEQQQAIERWLCDYADRRQTYNEVDDVANGSYD